MCGTREVPGGINDISKDKSDKVVKGITDTLGNSKDRKVLLVGIPYIYDLADWSYFNREIKNVNMNLKTVSNILIM